MADRKLKIAEAATAKDGPKERELLTESRYFYLNFFPNPPMYLQVRNEILGIEQTA